MRPGSLRLRMMAAAGVAMTAALSTSGLVLARIFAQHVEQRVQAELLNHLNQIASRLEITSDGLTLTTPPADPRFFSPNSGLYWQIDVAGHKRQRSRSLWEFELTLPRDDMPDGKAHNHDIAGPLGTRLLAVERILRIGTEQASLAAQLTVAIDRHEIEQAATDFRSILIRSLAVLGLAMLAGLSGMVQYGLRPLSQVGAALQRVHSGSKSHVDGRFPAEVQPLVQDMNALLDRERATIESARERAADLAHGLKTPLSVLAAIARDLRREGMTASAVEVEAQLDLMGRHVTRELARARLTGATFAGTAPVPVRPVIDQVVVALRRILDERHVVWVIVADDGVEFRGNEDDLLELAGNICDNAAKWAQSRIEIALRARGGAIDLSFHDDGPGIPTGAEVAAQGRGRRLDETAGGTGLGLSIVRKIVDVYDGGLTLEKSHLGGLAVEVSLPGGRRART